ncbi:AraC family transcriptional regulator [Leeuwenhoekiella aequorea]|uniref:helix-turn-helix domain-containing protein n=1 Tax=Leeuwenhoekiella TaxID=283735 RepID=UPI00048C0B44|nr:AraC family transcriptional regulator [Leeuwenhoekiella sp. MAR_2009_132]AOE07245.1 transcriptional regulator, AraC family [uncultured bacterium]|tara:strand:- start:15650 stop:16567 length:918 start_codon:yes stop_codon:yes gene_type:complete
MQNICKVKTIEEFHFLSGLESPKHPLVSIINYSGLTISQKERDSRWMLEFYLVAIKRGLQGKMYYGQQEYDCDEGIMFFVAPKQVFRIQPDPSPNEDRSGWMLLIHPDFIWNTSLAKTISKYDFFDYSINEALFLSEEEEETFEPILNGIKKEYQTDIDQFSQNIITAHIETLLQYSERFYQRQFTSRKVINSKLVERFEYLILDYFNSDVSLKNGLPSVQSLAEQLHITPKYLSKLLKGITGQSPQQHIQEKVVELAKFKLSSTEESVNEIAYNLGFAHPQSFNKLFKRKTELSPLQFRKSFIQ